MSVFLDFLEEISALFEANADSSPSPDEAQSVPGLVTICFVNRYLEPMDGIKYKIKFDGKTVSGTTTATEFNALIRPVTLGPVKVYVWSRRISDYKLIDTIIPLMNKPKLVYEHMRSFKHSSKTHPHPKNEGKPPESEPRPPKPAPGDSPTDNQGAHPEHEKNKNDEPVHKGNRPVPDKITVAQLRKIFPLAKADYLQSVADECNKDLVKYHLDTLYRKAHFFAQIRGETGAAMKPITENWEYSPETLMAFSSYYRRHPLEAKQDGFLREPARKRGERGKIIRHADQQSIGRKHFLKRNGNRLDHPDDGYNFRGRGLIQITGYEKYSKFQEQYLEYFEGEIPDTVANPELVNRTPFAIQSAIWFWNYSLAYQVADGRKGVDDVADVTKVINGGEMGENERETGYNLAEAAFK